MKNRVLLVDDDIRIRVLYKRLLEKQFNLQVYLAKDGLEGLALTKSVKPEFVLCDIDMPNIDGVEYLERIRGDEKTRDMLVVMMTSTDDPEMVRKIVSLGVADYILKANDLDHFSSRIRSILEKYNERLLNKQVIREKDNKQGRKIILLIGTPKNFVDMFSEKIPSEWQVVSCDFGTDGLTLYKKLKPRFVFVAEHVEKLNERIISKKIKEFDTWNDTTVILLYMSKFYKNRDEFDASIWVEHWARIEYSFINDLINGDELQ